jgi:hypothetical protein
MLSLSFILLFSLYYFFPSFCISFIPSFWLSLFFLLFLLSFFICFFLPLPSAFQGLLLHHKKKNGFLWFKKTPMFSWLSVNPHRSCLPTSPPRNLSRIYCHLSSVWKAFNYLFVHMRYRPHEHFHLFKTQAEKRNQILTILKSVTVLF